MMGKSHFLIGAAVGLVLGAAIQPTIQHSAAFALAAAWGAMLPDLDHRHAPIRRQLGFVGNVLLFWLPHRGLTHSLLMLVINTALLWLIGKNVGLAVALGYTSHIIADMMTRKGVPVFMPLWNRSLHVLPPFLRLTTGKLGESIVTGAICAASVWITAQMVL